MSKALSPATGVEEEETNKKDDWSFGVIRVLRVLVAVAVLFALMLDFQGAFQRVVEQPVLLAVAIATMSQIVQVEDIEKITTILNK